MCDDWGLAFWGAGLFCGCIAVVFLVLEVLEPAYLYSIAALGCVCIGIIIAHVRPEGLDNDD